MTVGLFVEVDVSFCTTTCSLVHVLLHAMCGHVPCAFSSLYLHVLCVCAYFLVCVCVYRQYSPWPASSLGIPPVCLPLLVVVASFRSFRFVVFVGFIPDSFSCIVRAFVPSALFRWWWWCVVYVCMTFYVSFCVRALNVAYGVVRSRRVPLLQCRCAFMVIAKPFRSFKTPKPFIPLRALIPFIIVRHVNMRCWLLFLMRFVLSNSLRCKQQFC